MEYRYLGAAGLRVSALSFGSWVTFGQQVDVDMALESMRVAYEAGVNFFDNAEVYANGRSEEIMGEAFRRAGWKRSNLVVSTKIFWGGEGPNDIGLTRKHIREGVDASLERLGMSYVDLLFCHRPDPQTPIEETVRAMNQVIDQGKAFYWGTSEWSAQQIMEAWAVARRERLIPPQMEQPQYNMLHRERVEKEYHRLYSLIGLGTTIWSPLASGFLTGKYDDGIPEGSRLALAGYDFLKDRYHGDWWREVAAKVRALQPIAEELDCTRAQLAIAWCLKNPRVSTVITGASSPEQVRENMAALAVAEQLGPAVLERIEQVLDNRPQDIEPSFR